MRWHQGPHKLSGTIVLTPNSGDVLPILAQHELTYIRTSNVLIALKKSVAVPFTSITLRTGKKKLQTHPSPIQLRNRRTLTSTCLSETLFLDRKTPLPLLLTCQIIARLPLHPQTLHLPPSPTLLSRRLACRLMAGLPIPLKSLYLPSLPTFRAPGSIIPRT